MKVFEFYRTTYPIWWSNFINDNHHVRGTTSIILFNDYYGKINYNYSTEKFTITFTDDDAYTAFMLRWA